MSDPSGASPKPKPTRRRPRPPSFAACDADPTRGKAENLRASLPASRKAEIDALLVRQQRAGAIEPDGARAGAAVGAGAEAVGPSPGHVGGRLPMSDEELADARADVFGRPPPHAARSRERLLALEREVRRLPKSERRALTKAVDKHRLLFVNCPHTKLILGREEEDFDAASAARRLARYWEFRRRMFGDGGCYAPGTFPEPLFSDYMRYYQRKLAIMADPDTDGEAREEAEDLVKAVQDVKIRALNFSLEQLEEDALQRFNPEGPEDHDEAMATEAILDNIAMAMAMDSPDELKLQFLQVEDMDEANAAQRLVRYYKMGLRLFGPDFEERRSVTLRDMENCSVLFDVGFCRLMPGEDQWGRSILVSRHLTEERMLELGVTGNDCARVIWYVIHAALEHESCQRNGFVALVDLRGILLSGQPSYRQLGVEVAASVPTKLRAVHLLFHPGLPLWQRIVGDFINIFSVLSVSLSRRLVVHVGTDQETLSELNEKFGIAEGNLPVDIGGSLESECFGHWLEDRRAAGT